MESTSQDQVPHTERRMPQAVEIEKAVLGAMLLEQRAIDQISEILDPTCFYHTAHRQIFEAMIHLCRLGMAVDPHVLAEELERRGQLETVGGIGFLTKLECAAAKPTHIHQHAQVVQERAVSRRLIKTASEVIDQAYKGTVSMEELVGDAAQRLFRLDEDLMGEKPEPLSSVLADAIGEIGGAHHHPGSDRKVGSGFDDLDDLISGGFRQGDLIVLASAPGVGTTALGLTLARNAAVEAGVGVAIFCSETSKIHLARRLLSIETRVDLHRFHPDRLREDDWTCVRRKSSLLARAPIYIDDSPGITVFEARSRVRRLQRHRNIGMVLVGSIQQNPGGESPSSSRGPELPPLSSELKAMARSLDLPVLALTPLTGALENHPDRRPQLADLRESGGLEEYADLVMFLYRPEIYGLRDLDGASLEGFAEVIIAKHRHGPVGTVYLSWIAESATFEPCRPTRVGDVGE